MSQAIATELKIGLRNAEWFCVYAGEYKYVDNSNDVFMLDCMVCFTCTKKWFALLGHIVLLGCMKGVIWHAHMIDLV